MMTVMGAVNYSGESERSLDAVGNNTSDGGSESDGVEERAD